MKENANEILSIVEYLTSNLTDKNIKTYYKNYLLKIANIYGTKSLNNFDGLKIVILSNPEDLNASGADLINNTLYINPKSSDFEYDLYHECEHIRTAHNPYKSNLCGTNKLGLGSTYLTALNEALTEISVVNLIKRQHKKSIAYTQTKLFVQKFFILLNIPENVLLTYYSNNPNKILELEKLIDNLIGEKGFFDRFEYFLQTYHDNHLNDLDNEIKNFSYIKNKPYGSLKSKQTIFAENILNNEIFDTLIKKLASIDVSKSEISKRLKKFEQLQLSIENHFTQTENEK